MKFDSALSDLSLNGLMKIPNGLKHKRFGMIFSMYSGLLEEESLFLKEVLNSLEGIEEG